jgi:fructosamine-3-kinase
MSGPTQRAVSHGDVVAMVREAFGAETVVLAAERIAGGTFGVVWRVDLAHGRPVVLKVGPAAGTRLLTYEAGLAAAEAEYLRLVAAGAPEVPMARLLHAGDGWLAMSLLPGVPMSTLPSDVDTSPVRSAVGGAVAQIHKVVGTRYGYQGDRPHGATWPQAFGAMTEAVLDDAVTWGVDLPVPAGAVRSVVSAHRTLLATITTPSLLHFDLWDGNVLATVGPDGRAELGGLVDGERYLYGDPLVDFVSPALFGDILTNPDGPYLRGYRSVAPFHVDDQVHRRLWLYQLYLYLIMTVEYPSRGMDRAANPQRWAKIQALVRDLVAKLST